MVTGGARGIGRAIVAAFAEQAAAVCTIDLFENDYFVGDIAEEADLLSRKFICGE